MSRSKLDGYIAMSAAPLEEQALAYRARRYHEAFTELGIDVQWTFDADVVPPARYGREQLARRKEIIHKAAGLVVASAAGIGGFSPEAQIDVAFATSIREPVPTFLTNGIAEDREHPLVQEEYLTELGVVIFPASGAASPLGRANEIIHCLAALRTAS